MNVDKQKVQELLNLTKPLKLLYVEDNADAREQTLKMLKNFFKDITVAKDGEEGLQRYKETCFDLIITDINMPKMNGLEMSRKILKINPEQYIIILSAYNDTQYLESCIELGVTNYLHKPVDLEKIVTTLDKTVHTLLDKNRLKQLNKQINNLLNNAKEGYLSFDKDLKCNSGYSQKCLNIFELDDIEGLDISELLFKDDHDKKLLFQQGIKNILETQNELEKELYISLLPNEQNINNKIVNISYKQLDNQNFMVILKDITQQKELETQLYNQENIKNMLLAIATNKDAFLELVKEFEEFLKEPPKSIEILLRELHTFKGNFSQQEMIYIVNTIHHIEDKVKQTKTITSDMYQELSNSLKKDLEIIKSNFNSNFLEYEKNITIKENDLINIEQKISNLPFVDEKFQKKIEEILFYLNRFRYIPLKNLLLPYQKYLKNLSEKLEKPIYPLEITGDKDVIVPEKFKPFTKSLVHLFNNSLVHGIEDVETREELGKDPIGTISCSFQQIQNTVLLEISDNGGGIDSDKLIQRVVAYGLKTQQECENLTEEEKLSLIFLDGVSTCDSVDLLKGRGVGMSAIYQEVQKLDGKVFITSKKNKGSQFEFLLPIELECYKSLDDKEVILDSITSQILSFLNQTKQNYQLKNKRYIDTIEPLVGYNHINITFNNSKRYNNCLLSLPDEIVDTLREIFMIEDSDDIDKYEIFKEVTNIIVGLAISNFPEDYNSITISTPCVTTDKQITADIKNSKEYAIYEIDFDRCKIYCTILETNKVKEEVC